MNTEKIAFGITLALFATLSMAVFGAIKPLIPNTGYNGDQILNSGTTSETWKAEIGKDNSRETACCNVQVTFDDSSPYESLSYEFIGEDTSLGASSNIYKNDQDPYWRLQQTGQGHNPITIADYSNAQVTEVYYGGHYCYKITTWIHLQNWAFFWWYDKGSADQEVYVFANPTHHSLDLANDFSDAAFGTNYAYFDEA